jgi:hypothetical protein
VEANLIMTDKADSSFLEQTFMKKFNPEQITTSVAKNLDCQLDYFCCQESRLSTGAITSSLSDRSIGSLNGCPRRTRFKISPVMRQ